MAASYAFVTLVTSDSYLPGALALVAALKDVHPHPHNTHFQTACLVTPESVDVSTIKHLRRAFDVVIGVELITQHDQARLALLGRPDLNTVLTKLHIFRLNQYSKIIFLDADVLPIRPLSHLFTLPHEFSASPDVGWPDIFNTGVMVLSPGQDKFNQLMDLLKTRGSWDGGDQGILNEWRGNNWNRLSFTYNTTPTAAYTYAPAYERYGSQISAIHFIGPNKPWSSLSHRFPSSQQPAPLSDPSEQAYDYNSLVDRWYSVYDKHYRTHAISHQHQFEIKRYESAWNEVSNAGRAAVARPSVENTLSLEELRRLAIEGMNASSQTFHEKDFDDENALEGHYQSMPLEGRVDLMRPANETTITQKGTIAEENHQGAEEQTSPRAVQYEEDPRTPTARTPGWSSSHRRSLPTPGPNEVPTSPHPQTIPLPPVTPSADFDLHTFQAQSEPDSPSIRPHKLQALKSQPKPQIIPTSYSNNEQPKNYQHGPQRKEPARPHSPTMLLWNPAIEPPPTEIPSSSSFPSNTYFQNAWDPSPSKPADNQPHTPIPSSVSLFEPLPPSEIPESLIKQGHYRNVTGEEQLGATPSPDSTKVKHIFPWEEKPRHLPGRVFPAADSPRVALFLSPESQSSQTSSDLPTTPETKSARPAPVLSPLHGLPSSLSYPNAWDHVPSIQRYASRLGRPPAPPLLAPAFDEDGWDKRKGNSWDEKIEASSRDGDVEDEGEESADEQGKDEMWDDDSDPESAKALQRRSRRGSSVSLASQTKSKSKGGYRNYGVQTTVREMRSRGTQTSHPYTPPNPSSGTPVDLMRKEVVPVADRRHGSFSNRSPASTRHVSSPVSPPTGDTPFRAPLVSVSHSPLPSGVRSPLVPNSRPSNITTPPLKAPIRGPQPAGAGTFSVTMVSRQPSNDSSLGSPASSIGPISPSDGQPIGSPSQQRRGSRVWDPARGVELFKRGSEEVLARFLKMGSWEDENR